MSWMHDRVNVTRSRRQSAQEQSELTPLGGRVGAAAEHVAIPRILGRRARWMTSRLSGRVGR